MTAARVVALTAFTLAALGYSVGYAHGEHHRATPPPAPAVATRPAPYCSAGFRVFESSTGSIAIAADPSCPK